MFFRKTKNNQKNNKKKIKAIGNQIKNQIKNQNSGSGGVPGSGAGAGAGSKTQIKIKNKQVARVLNSCTRLLQKLEVPLKIHCGVDTGRHVGRSWGRLG